MKNPPIFTKQNKQAGIVLLILASFFMVLGVTTFLVAVNNSQMQNTQQQTSILKTKFALKQAKETLITYALTQLLADRQLSLPCPDGGTATEGEAKPCGSKHVNKLGRLPWKTLRLPPLKDGSGECLWYAVSGDFKNAGNNELVNQDSKGMFKIHEYDGTNTKEVSNDNDKAIAVIISAGKAVNAQDRTNDPNKSVELCGGNYLSKNYLESIDTFNNSEIATEKDKIESFVSISLSNTSLNENFNDYIEYITFNEMWNMLDFKSDLKAGQLEHLKINYLSIFNKNIDFKELTEKLAKCLSEEHANLSTSPITLPWTIALEEPTYDFRENKYYKLASSKDSTSPYLGRLPCVALDSTATDCQVNKDSSLCSSLTLAEAFLWENWKDHFFYALSANFAPDSTPIACADDNCIKYNGNYYAAIVFFSGEGQPEGTSNSLPNQLPRTDKTIIANYLEGNNATRYPDEHGSATYLEIDEDSNTILTTKPEYEKAMGSNDVLYCIDEILQVDECPL